MKTRVSLKIFDNGCSCVRKETVDKDILITSRNGDKKNHAIYQNNN